MKNSKGKPSTTITNFIQKYQYLKKTTAPCLLLRSLIVVFLLQINITMYPIVDFRNARYQGQIKNNLPDGIGIIIDANQMFCMAEWVAGQIKGPTVIIYPSGRTFCGHIEYEKAELINTHQLESDHVQLVTYVEHGADKDPAKIAAILPLQQIILEIDNTNPKHAKVVDEYEYSVVNEQSNLATISRILNLDSEGPKALKRYTNCLRFMEEYFAIPYADVIQFFINERNGKKEYFFGLRGGGLGIKIEPLEQPTLNLKKTGRVYYIRGLGVFSKEGQLKQIGLKMIDNAMKGIVVEQGVFSLPRTLIKYQIGKRPKNCWETFYNYLKRSLFFRDQVIPLNFIYSLERFVLPFQSNLQKLQTEKIAQITIQKPNNSGQNLIAIERKRTQKDRAREEYFRKRGQESKSPNPYNPDYDTKYTNPEYNLQRAKDEIYRSVSKRRQARDQFDKVDYKNVQYVDPNYIKVTASQRQPKRVHALEQKQESRNKSGYKYNSGKNHTEELKQYYQRNFSPNKQAEWKRERRSPDQSDVPHNYYHNRSNYQKTKRGYSNHRPSRRSPLERNSDRYQNNQKGDDEYTRVNSYHQYEKEGRPYKREERYGEGPYRREDPGYRRKQDEKYHYYYDDERQRNNNDQYREGEDSYDYRPYRQRKNRSPYRPFEGSPGKKNLRKKILKSNHYD